MYLKRWSFINKNNLDIEGKNGTKMMLLKLQPPV